MPTRLSKRRWTSPRVVGDGPRARLRRGVGAAPEQGGQQAERHLTGQELCEAIRRYALDEYGYMAKSVLNSWGVKSTRDFGNIVFNLIEIGRMKKTKQDRLEDFDNAYDFETAFRKQFKIGPLETSSG